MKTEKQTNTVIGKKEIYLAWWNGYELCKLQYSHTARCAARPLATSSDKTHTTIPTIPPFSSRISMLIKGGRVIFFSQHDILNLSLSLSLPLRPPA